jgi:hypothetical protein
MESIVAHPTLRFPSAVDNRVDRRLPSEGKGHTFESCQVRHKINYLVEVKLTTNSPKIIQRWRRICGDRGSFAYEPLADFL